MSQKKSLVVGCLAVLCVLGLLATPAQATLVMGFQFAAGGNSVTVPSTGGSYVVNLVLSSDTAGVTNLTWSNGFWGALSSVMNSNLGNATLDGDITAQSMPASMTNTPSGPGTIFNTNGDGRDDLGPVANTTTGNATPAGSTPWWVHPNGGAVGGSGDGGTTVLLGSFTVTVPAYTPNGNTGDFLNYRPTIQASSITNYDVWFENGSSRLGKFQTTTGSIAVNPGTTVTFTVVPEPATLVLLGLGGLALIAVSRARRRS